MLIRHLWSGKFVGRLRLDDDLGADRHALVAVAAGDADLSGVFVEVRRSEEGETEVVDIHGVVRLSVRLDGNLHGAYKAEFATWQFTCSHVGLARHRSSVFACKRSVGLGDVRGL